MNKSTKKKLTSILLSICIIAVIIILDKLGIIKIDDYIEEDSSYVNVNTTGLYEVVRVVDGDTIVINYNGKEEKVRLIGVDTPESVHPNKEKNNEYGTLASKYTKSKLEKKSVSLEFDVQERDKYGRLLAYVYLDGKMYNKTLLEDGYAQVATYPPNVKYVDDFLKIEKKAKENNAGLWSYEEE